MLQRYWLIVVLLALMLLLISASGKQPVLMPKIGRRFAKSQELPEQLLVASCGPAPDISGARIVSQRLKGGTAKQPLGLVYDWIRYECLHNASMEPPEAAVVVCRKVPLKNAQQLSFDVNWQQQQQTAVWAFSPMLADAGIANLPTCVKIVSEIEETTAVYGSTTAPLPRSATFYDNRDDDVDKIRAKIAPFPFPVQQQPSNRTNRALSSSKVPKAAAVVKQSVYSQGGPLLAGTPVRCGPPPDIPYSVVVSERIADGFRIGRPYDWVRYGCKEGYYLVGSEIVVCLLTGRWVNAKESLPICLEGVASPTTPATPPVYTYTISPSTTASPIMSSNNPYMTPTGRQADYTFRHHHSHVSPDLVLARLFGLIDQWLQTGQRPSFPSPSDHTTTPSRPATTPFGYYRWPVNRPYAASSGIGPNLANWHAFLVTDSPLRPGQPSSTRYYPAMTLSTARPADRNYASWDWQWNARMSAGGKMPTCGPPPYIPDADIVASSLKTVYDMGYPRDWVQYECPARFEMYSSDTVVCMPDGRWMNEYATLPLCLSPGNCPPPPEMPLATVDYTSLSPGSLATYYCSDEKDYAMIGTSNIALCQRNATWTKIDFECLLASLPRSCDKPPLIRYGRITEENRYSNFGWSVSYICDNTPGARSIFCHPYRGWGKPPRCPPPPRSETERPTRP